MRVKYYASTVCYLVKDDKVLFIKFDKKWGKRYAPPGGKVDEGETPTECIVREFFEETGLKLIEPKLKGISYWDDGTEGVIFVYTADNYEGIISESSEGKIEWVDKSTMNSLEQFEMNKEFSKYLFEDGLFEGKFLLDNNTKIKEFNIRKI